MSDHLRHHIEAITTRSLPDTLRLTHQLHVGCWPGGGADHVEPAALEWVRRWGPASDADASLVCMCVSGRCSICN
jgi:hypothetical protein